MKPGITHFSPVARSGVSLSSAALFSPKTNAALSELLVFLNAGDIQELYDTTLALGHAAAFSDDCDLPSFQDRHRLVGLQVRRCLRNPACALLSHTSPPATQDGCALHPGSPPAGLLGAEPKAPGSRLTPQLHSLQTPGQVTGPCKSHFPYLKHGNNSIYVVVFCGLW